MNDMFKKVNAREKLVGWYHSGPKLRASDLEINELFKRYTPNPLLVIIDVQPKESGVPTDAYFAVEEIKDVSCSLTHQKTGQGLMIVSSLLRHRMERRLPERLSTHRPSSRPRKQRKSESSTCYGTSVTSLLAPCPRASLTSSSRSKGCISGYETLEPISRKSSTASSPSTTRFSATCKTSSTFSPTSPRQKTTARREATNYHTP